MKKDDESLKSDIKRFKNFKIEFDECEKEEKILKTLLSYMDFDKNIQRFHESSREEFNKIRNKILDDEEKIRIKLKRLNNEMENGKAEKV